MRIFAAILTALTLLLSFAPVHAEVIYPTRVFGAEAI
jgi:hypothetical protein